MNAERITCVIVTSRYVEIFYERLKYQHRILKFTASALLFPSRDFVPVVVLQSLAKEPALVNVLGFTLVILAGMFKAMSMVVVRRNKGKAASTEDCPRFLG